MAAEKSWLTSPGVGVHRAADVHQEEDAHVGLSRRSQNDLELAGVSRRLVDGLFEVKLGPHAFAREGAELPQRDLHLADIQHEVRTVGPVCARIRYRHRASTTALRADAHACWIRSVRAEGAGPAGANPAASAVVAFRLLAHPLFEQPAQLGPVEALEHGELFGGQLLARPRIAEPLLELPGEIERTRFDAPEMSSEGLVIGVEVGLGVDAERARDTVKPLQRALVQPHRKRTRESHGLLETYAHLALAQLEEERNEDHPYGG